MTRTSTALAVAATVPISALMVPATADARWHHHHGFPIVALAPPPHHYAYAPVYAGPRCYFRSERIWNGWTWLVRRVERCW